MSDKKEESKKEEESCETLQEMEKSLSYCLSKEPAYLKILELNTNLNELPSHWPDDNFLWEGLHSARQEDIFYSLRLARDYMHMTGLIDVISSAENIKKLLKMPYSKTNVSLMVHRIGNTLTIDNFDVHQHLLRQQKDDWEWLKKFYHEVFTKTSVAEINKDKQTFSQNMLSKYLYHSSLEQSFTKNSFPSTQRTHLWNFEDIRMLIGTDLPIFGGGTHPCVSVKLQDMKEPINVLTGLDYWLDNLMCNVPELAMCYHDNGVVKSYELVKTEEIPECEGSSFSPGVIKDIASNILSFLKNHATQEGHTYWLFKPDNDDIVKLYDLTDLCDNLTKQQQNKKNNNKKHENTRSKSSPKEEESSDESDDDTFTNPFTIPVGVLLFQLAHNMHNNTKCASVSKKQPVLHQLFTHSHHLLKASKLFQLLTSCHYCLSDLMVCDHFNETTASKESSSSDCDEILEVWGCGDKEVDGVKVFGKGGYDYRQYANEAPCIGIQSLRKKHLPKKKNKRPIKTGQDKVHLKALMHVIKALENIDKFEEEEKKRRSKKQETDGAVPKKQECKQEKDVKEETKGSSKSFCNIDDIPTWNSDTPIPMPYHHDDPLCAPKQQEDQQDGCQAGGYDCNFLISPFKQNLNAKDWSNKARYLLVKKACTISLKGALSQLPLHHTNLQVSHKQLSLVISSFNAMLHVIKQTSSITCMKQHLRAGLAEYALYFEILMFIGDFCLVKSALMQKGIYENNNNGRGDDKVTDDNTLKNQKTTGKSGNSTSNNSNTNNKNNNKKSKNRRGKLESRITWSETQTKFLRLLQAAMPHSQDHFPQISNILNILEQPPFTFDAKLLALEEYFEVGEAHYREAYELVERVGKVGDERKLRSLRRIANFANEISRFYISLVSRPPPGVEIEDWRALVCKCKESYMRSIEVFKRAHDLVNQALVTSNLANTFYIEAQLHRAQQPLMEVSKEELQCFHMACKNYKDSISLLQHQPQQDLHHIVLLLLKICHKVPQLIQRFPPTSFMSKQQMELECTSWYKKCLSFKLLSSHATYAEGHMYQTLASFHLLKTRLSNLNPPPTNEDMTRDLGVLTTHLNNNILAFIATACLCSVSVVVHLDGTDKQQIEATIQRLLGIEMDPLLSLLHHVADVVRRNGWKGKAAEDEDVLWSLTDISQFHTPHLTQLLEFNFQRLLANDGCDTHPIFLKATCLIMSLLMKSLKKCLLEVVKLSKNTPHGLKYREMLEYLLRSDESPGEWKRLAELCGAVEKDASGVGRTGGGGGVEIGEDEHSATEVSFNTQKLNDKRTMKNNGSDKNIENTNGDGAMAVVWEVQGRCQDVKALLQHLSHQL